MKHGKENKHVAAPKDEDVEIVVEAPPPPTPLPPPPAPVSMEPKFLGDWTVDDNFDRGTTKIAWASEEGIRRVEIPSYIFRKLRQGL